MFDDDLMMMLLLLSPLSYPSSMVHRGENTYARYLPKSKLYERISELQCYKKTRSGGFNP